MAGKLGTQNDTSNRIANFCCYFLIGIVSLSYLCISLPLWWDKSVTQWKTFTRSGSVDVYHALDSHSAFQSYEFELDGLGIRGFRLLMIWGQHSSSSLVCSAQPGLARGCSGVLRCGAQDITPASQSSHHEPVRIPSRAQRGHGLLIDLARASIAENLRNEGSKSGIILVWGLEDSASSSFPPSWFWLIHYHIKFE